jgi:hypothetical protein
VRTLLLLFVGLSLIAATPAPTACPSPAPPPPEVRHRSGLAVVGPLPRCIAPPFEPLAKAYSDAWLLGQAHPDAFGYPWDDRAKRELVLSVVSPDGERLARSWIATGATVANGTKSAVLPPPTVPVRIRPVTRSFAQLMRLEDDIIAFIRSGVTDTSAIHSFGHDDEHDRIMIEVDHLTDALATALADRFATEAIAVRVDPSSTSVTSIAGRLDDGQERGPYIAIAIAIALIGIGLVVALRLRASARTSSGSPPAGRRRRS